MRVWGVQVLNRQTVTFDFCTAFYGYADILSFSWPTSPSPEPKPIFDEVDGSRFTIIIPCCWCEINHKRLRLPNQAEWHCGVLQLRELRGQTERNERRFISDKCSSHTPLPSRPVPEPHMHVTYKPLSWAAMIHGHSALNEQKMTLTISFIQMNSNRTCKWFNICNPLNLLKLTPKCQWGLPSKTLSEISQTHLTILFKHLWCCGEVRNRTFTMGTPWRREQTDWPFCTMQKCS